MRTQQAGGKKWLIYGSALALVALSSVSSAQRRTSNAKQAQLDTLQQELQQKRTAYREIETREQDVLAELRTIDAAIQTCQEQLTTYQGQEAEQQHALQTVQKQLDQLQHQHQDKQKLLAARLRAIYKMGALGYLTPLFAMASYDDAQQQMMYLQRIAENDARLMADAQKDAEVIAAQKEALEQHKQELTQARQAIKKQQTEMAAQKRQKDRLLAQIQHDKEQFGSTIKRLELSSAELELFLAKLDAAPPALPTAAPKSAAGPQIEFPTDEQAVVQSYDGRFRANKGKLIWPVQGKILTNFGPLRIGETFTQYKGVDIQAKSGTPFYAVFKGKVKYADWFEGYGNLVILDHGGMFYTLYAHAQEIAVKSGDTVETRQILGKVGDADAVKGAHLYFEVRVNGKPVDPHQWLAKLR